MRLTGEAARKYLQENPNARFTDNRSGQVYGAEAQGSGFLGNLVKGITKPFRQGAGVAEEFGLTIKDLMDMIGGESVDPYARQNEGYKYALLDEEESDLLARDPLQAGIKSGAGVAAYGLPGGGGGAATTAGRIGTAAARGAGAGALGGFGASEEGSEFESALKGAGLGGLIGGGIQAGGEALKALQQSGLGDKLQNASDDLKVTAIKKKVGVAPTAKQGKYGLVKDVANVADDFNVKIKGPEDVAGLSDEIFGRYGSLADEYAKAFDEAGNMIDINDIKQPLINQLQNTKTPELQKPIQNVLNSIDEAAGGSPTIGADELLNLRREWGNLGNWNQFTPTNERMAAAVWEDAYSTANDVLDQAFKKAGYGQFREVNKLLKTGIEARNWAQRAEAYRRGSPVWNDMTQDALAMGAAGLGGGIGGAAGVAGSKVLQANAEGIASKGLGGLSKILQGVGPVAEGVGNVASQVGPIAQQVGAPLAGQMAAGSQPQVQPQQEQMQETQGGLAQDELQALNFYLANAVLQGDISSSDANSVLDLLGVSGDQGGSGKDQSKAVALQESLNKLRSAWEGTGGGGKLMETLGLNIGTNARSLDQAKAAVAEDLGRLQSQGAINKDELKTFNSMMPNSWDSPAVVQQKLQAIQDRINAYL